MGTRGEWAHCDGGKPVDYGAMFPRGVSAAVKPPCFCGRGYNGMELRAECISRRYFRQGKGRNVFYAVKEASLTLREGFLTEITGRSGSGKSTLLHMLAGLLEPTEGRVYLDGADLYALKDGPRSRLRNQILGMIPQGKAVLQSLTVAENIALPGLMYGQACPETRVEELLELVGIARLRNVYPNELSGGELRRLAVARAMALHPGILLADEPTSELDDENTRAVLSLLRRCADEGAAVLLVTHEKEAKVYADRHYHMENGLLTEDGFTIPTANSDDQIQFLR